MPKNPLGYTDEEVRQARDQDPDIDAVIRVREANFRRPHNGLAAMTLASSLRALRVIADGLGKPLSDIDVADIITWLKREEG